MGYSVLRYGRHGHRYMRTKSPASLAPHYRNGTLSTHRGTLGTHMGYSECSHGYSGYSHGVLWVPSWGL